MIEPREPKRKKHRTLAATERTVCFARKLRKEMSLPEVLLWQQLKLHPGGYQFRKQHPLERFVLDFACVKARLAIEVDGISHDMGERSERDEARDAFVLKQGFKTLRIPATEVLKHMDDVLNLIVKSCRERAAPNPPRNGEVAVRRADGGAGSGEGKASGIGARGHRPLRRFTAPPRSGEDFA